MVDRRTVPFPPLPAFAPIAIALLVLSCDPPVPPAAYGAVITVESDPGVPLEGAALLRDGVKVADTKADGRARFSLRGAEGDIVELHVKCPNAYDSPTAALSIRMRKLADDKVPEYLATCAPRFRSVVVAVRAENGADLPIMYLGRAIATTDAFGIAHSLISAKPGETMAITLDTSARPRLRPQNPSAQYLVKNADDAFVMEQKFAEEKLAPVKHFKPQRPVAIPPTGR